MAKKKWGDRKDGVWLKDIPAMNRLMPSLLPNRADNEAHISINIDLRPLNAYLEKLNEGRTEDKYTFFHLISAAIAKGAEGNMKRGCQRVKLGPNSKRSHEKNTGQKKEREANMQNLECFIFYKLQRIMKLRLLNERI